MMHRRWTQVLVLATVVGGGTAPAVPVETVAESTPCRNLYLSAEYAFAYAIVKTVARQDCEPEIRERAIGHLRSSLLTHDAVIQGVMSFIRIDILEPGHLKDDDKPRAASAVIQELRYRRDEVQRMTHGLPQEDEFRNDLPDKITEEMSADQARVIVRNQTIKQGAMLRLDLEHHVANYDHYMQRLRELSYGPKGPPD